MLKSGNESLTALLKGMNALGDAVKKTIGPRGRNVFLDKGFGITTISNDGFEISKVINFSDRNEDNGAAFLRDAARKTHEVAGDGCSATIVIAQSIINEGVMNITSGSNPVLIRSGIKKAAAAVVDYIYSNAVYPEEHNKLPTLLSAIKDEEEIIQNMKLIFEKIADGKIITVEESTNPFTIVESCEGMTLDNGYISPYFVKNKNSLEIVLERPYVLLTEKVISDFSDLLPVIEAVGDGSLLIIAADVVQDALSNLLLNVLKEKINSVVVRAGGYGMTGSEVLKDVAVFTGGKVIDSELWDLQKNDLMNLGRADRAKISVDSSIIINGAGSEQQVNARIKELEEECYNTDSGTRRLSLRNRIARINKDTTIIKVGASTNTELQEQKNKYEKALSSCYGAYYNGICPGGGVMYLRAISVVNELINTLSGDEKTGAMILRKALDKPAYYIFENAGLAGEKIVADIIEAEGLIGFDVIKDTYTDMIESNLADPAKVIAVALENAVSSACLFLTTEAIVT